MMYGKIFSTIYDGTLADNWQALVTFEQMIVLCDADGVLDMTPAGLHRRTGIPLDIIQEGIRFLELPDRQSKSEAEEGRRITRLDEHRDWGWKLVNHAYYKGLVDADTVREQNKVRQQRMRERRRGEEPGQADMLERDASRSVTVNNAKSRHTDTDTDTEKTKDMSGGPDPAGKLFEVWKEVYNHPRARLDPKRKKAITAALKLGYSVSELERAIRGYKNSAYHMGENDRQTVYDGLSLFLRDADHIDKGLSYADKAPTKGPDPTDPRLRGPNRGLNFDP
jgi:hypothetical protein